MMHIYSRVLAELGIKNSKCLYSTQRIYGRGAVGNCSARRKVLGRGLRNWKTASARTAPREFHVCEAGRKLLCEKEGAGRALAELE